MTLKVDSGIRIFKPSEQSQLERDKLLADLSANTSFNDTLDNVISAIKANQIELESSWHSSNSENIVETNKDSKVKTISFLYWAEQEKIIIPQIFIDKLDYVSLETRIDI